MARGETPDARSPRPALASVADGGPTTMANPAAKSQMGYNQRRRACCEMSNHVLTAALEQPVLNPF
jgi:hypothetical protein